MACAVRGTRFWLDAVDVDEVARVEQTAADLRDGGPRTLEAIEAALNELAGFVLRARAAVLAEADGGDLTIVSLDRGKVVAKAVTRGAAGPVVARRADLSEAAKEMLDAPHAIVGAPRPARGGKAKYLLRQIEDEARAALESKDPKRMLASLAAPALAGPDGVPHRLAFYRALVARPNPDAHEQLLRGLVTEVPEIAHAIAYRLYVQRPLAERLVREIDAARERLPASRPIARRLKAAIDEWPDFPTPLPPRTPEPSLRDALLEVVAELSRGDVGGFWGARRRIVSSGAAERRPALAATSDALRALAASGEPTIRGAALDLLLALGVPPAELAPATEGLPDVGGTREIRADAAADLPPAPLTPDPPLSRVLGDDGRGVPASRPVSVCTCKIETTAGSLARRVAFKDVLRMPVAGAADGGSFIATDHGLYAVDAKDVERWLCPTPELPARPPRGAYADLQPLVWVTGRRAFVSGVRELTIVDLDRGAILDVVPLPFEAAGFLPLGPESALALDGTKFFAPPYGRDLLPSGLVVHADGRTEPRLVPRALGSVRRSHGGVTADFTSFDVVLDRDGRRARYAIPGLVDVGDVVEGPGGVATVVVYVRPAGSVIYGERNAFGLPLAL